MKRHPICIAATMVCFFTSCGMERGEENTPGATLGQRQDEIVGGTYNPNDPAVVSITAEGQPFCTGTLVGPKTVITAAHCIYSYGRNVTYSIAIGPNAFRPSKRVRVASQIAHPNYNRRERDIGLLRLQSAVTDITPVEMNTTAFQNRDIGRPIRHVGYGITSGGGSGGGIKREVTYPLRQYSQWLLESSAPGKNTCQGDSGGPGLMQMGGNEVLVGIISWGDSNCAQLGVDSRVDSDNAWIRSTMAQWETPTCQRDGLCASSCASPDQDCVCVANGVCSPDCIDLLEDPDCPKDCVKNDVCSTSACPKPDPDCRPLGTACTSESQCQSRLCIRDAQSVNFYCSSRCDAQTPCGGELICTATNLCQYPLRPSRAPEESCQPGDFCLEKNVCTGPSEDTRRCARSCVNLSDCPEGFNCEVGLDSVSYCRAPEVTPEEQTYVKAPSTFSQLEGCSATQTAPLGALAVFALRLIRRRRTSA